MWYSQWTEKFREIKKNIKTMRYYKQKRRKIRTKE